MALPDFPGLDPAWTHKVVVADSTGVKHSWHVLDNGVRDPVGTLLCVHGNPTWSFLWRGLFNSAPTGWRVVAPDHLGMGYSAHLDRPRALQQRIDDLGHLADAVGLSGPVVTVGHDWGGAISLGWALAHVRQLKGIVLMNTAVAQPDGDRGPVLIRLAHMPLLREAVCVRTPTFVRATTALSWPPLPRDVRRALAAPYCSAARRRAIGDFVADIPFRSNHPSRTALEQIANGISSLDQPVLLLWGPRDPVFGDRYLADLRRRLPQAQLHRYEGASHLLPEDAPRYAEAVWRWVADLDERGNAGSAATGNRGHGVQCAASGVAAAPSPLKAARTLWSALDERADDDSPAVVEVGGVSVSWALLARTVRTLAAGLASAGFREGHRVALLMEPSAELTAAVYALWRAGAVVVLADKGLGFAGMRRALSSAAVDHVVGGARGLAAARLMGLPGSRIAAGRLSPMHMRALGADHSLASLAALGRRLPAPPGPAVDGDCAVVFTSGSTGPAKGVVYRHHQVQMQVELLRSTYSLQPQDRLVAAFAPFALLGPALGIGSAVPAIDVTAPGTLTAAALGDAAAAVGGTVVFASPAALRNVVATSSNLSLQQRSALDRIRLLVSAGAAVPPALLQATRKVMPQAEPHTPYGMTEALPVTDISLAEIEAAGAGDGVCVGYRLAGVDVAVSPLSADGQAVGPLTRDIDRTGELCVRADHIKDRYDALWATERDSSRDPGWHRTGDVGHLDRQGRLWFEGRLSHVITTESGLVTPVGVEHRAERLNEVAAAAAVGVGPPGAQVVVVVVVPTARVALGSRVLGGGLASIAGASLAPTWLADAVRGVAGVDVAAVLMARRLPLDIRHASKIDRQEVARWATRTLAGTADRGSTFCWVRL